MSSEDFESNQKNDGKISVKKSSFNGLIIGIIVAVGVAAFFAGSSFSNSDSDQVSAKDLQDAMDKLELKMLQNQLPTEQPKQAEQPMAPVKISADDDPVIGDPNAPITIIEFSDFECPFCARFDSQTLPKLLDEYIEPGKVKLVFRDFPIQSIHPNAVGASMAAECANEQGKFKEMHDIIFDNQNQWNKQDPTNAMFLFSQYATEIELEKETFDSCLASAKYIDEIRNDLNDGRAYGVTGTPGFFIGNDDIGYVELKGAQPFEAFKQVIDAQLGL